jgi:hypothetical protein
MPSFLVKDGNEATPRLKTTVLSNKSHRVTLPRPHVTLVDVDKVGIFGAELDVNLTLIPSSRVHIRDR